MLLDDAILHDNGPVVVREVGPRDGPQSIAANLGSSIWLS